MSRIRWKLTLGGLVLALGGLAAVADVPDKEAAAPPPAKPAASKVKLESAPVTLPAPAVISLPPAVPVPPSPPTIPPIAEPKPPPFTPPALTPAESPKSSPVMLPPVAAAVVPVFEAKVLAPVAPQSVAAPALPPPVPFPAAPQFAPLPVEPPPVEPPPAVVAAAPVPAKLADKAADKPPEKKLKVQLHMGDDRPKFEVRDGDEVYLKVTCDGVEVKSAAGGGLATMKAAGKVAFVTPGGDGTCDELTVVPGTGVVTVTGHVAFTYNWGKVETTVTGDKMAFRLGTAPGVTPTAAGTVTTTAGVR